MEIGVDSALLCHRLAPGIREAVEVTGLEPLPSRPKALESLGGLLGIWARGGAPDAPPN
ncbi:hypothetical protein [Streptomyces sp. NPDC001205]